MNRATRRRRARELRYVAGDWLTATSAMLRTLDAERGDRAVGAMVVMILTTPPPPGANGRGRWIVQHSVHPALVATSHDVLADALTALTAHGKLHVDASEFGHA
jgi:hypothetical protein